MHSATTKKMMKKKIYYPHHSNTEEKKLWHIPETCPNITFFSLLFLCVEDFFYGDAFTLTVLYVDRLSFIMDLWWSSLFSYYLILILFEIQVERFLGGGFRKSFLEGFMTKLRIWGFIGIYIKKSGGGRVEFKF
jgi:hypothetical protein